MYLHNMPELLSTFPFRKLKDWRKNKSEPEQWKCALFIIIPPFAPFRYVKHNAWRSAFQEVERQHQVSWCISHFTIAFCNSSVSFPFFASNGLCCAFAIAHSDRSVALGVCSTSLGRQTDPGTVRCCWVPQSSIWWMYIDMSSVQNVYRTDFVWCSSVDSSSFLVQNSATNAEKMKHLRSLQWLFEAVQPGPGSGHTAEAEKAIPKGVLITHVTLKHKQKHKLRACSYNATTGQNYPKFVREWYIITTEYRTEPEEENLHDGKNPNRRGNIS